MKTIKLTQGKEAIVDDKDYKYLNQWKWYYSARGYAVRTNYINGIQDANIKMHRIIVKTPVGMDTDHVNGNRLDNRRSNLRACTKAENSRNSHQPKTNFKSSSYKGVTKHTRKSGSIGWRARIGFKWGNISLGVYNNQEEAALAYNEAAKKYFGEFALLNKVDGFNL